MQASLSSSMTRETKSPALRLQSYQPSATYQKYESYRIEGQRLDAAIKKLEKDYQGPINNTKEGYENKTEEVMRADQNPQKINSTSGSDHRVGSSKEGAINTQSENDSLRNSLRNSAQSTRPSYSSSNQSQIEERVKTLEKELQRQKAQNEVLVNENKSLLEKIDLDPQRKQLESQLKAVKSENAGLIQEVQKLQQDLKRARSQSLSFTAPSANANEIESLKKNINQKTLEISDLRQKLLDSNKYKYESERLKTELARVKEILEKKIAQVDELSFKVKGLRNKEIENKELKKRYFLIRTACQMFQPKIQNLNNQLEQMEKLVHIDDVLDIEVEVRKLLDERDMLVNQNQRLRAPLQKALQNFEGSIQQVNKRIEEFDSLKKPFEQGIEGSIKTNQAEDGETIRLLQGKTTELAGFQGQFKERESVKADLDQMSKELKGVQDRFKKIPSQVDASNTFITAMRSSNPMEDFIDSVSRDFNNEKRWIENYAKILKERAAIEDSYARSLEKSIVEVNKLQSQGAVSEFLDCYKQYQTTKIEQSKALGGSLRDDIAGTLTNFASRKAYDLSEKIKIARERDRKVKLSMDEIEKAKGRYIHLIRRAEESESELKELQKSIVLQGESPRKDNVSIEGQIEEAESNLKTVITAYNETLPDFHQSIENLKNFMKEINVGKAMQLRDSLMKLIVYEISSLRNIQYDIDKIPKRLEAGDLDSLSDDSLPSIKMQINFSEIDYQEFIKLLGQKATEFKQKEIVYENTKSDVQFTWKTITTFISSTIEKNNEQKDAARQKKLDGLFALMLNSSQNQTDLINQEFTGVFNDKAARKGFVQQFQHLILNKTVILAPFDILEDQMKKVLSFFFNEVEKNKDWYVGLELYDLIKKKNDQIQDHIFDLKVSLKKLGEQKQQQSDQPEQNDEKEDQEAENLNENIDKLKKSNSLLSSLVRALHTHKIFQNMSFCTIYVVEGVKETLSNPKKVALVGPGPEGQRIFLIHTIMTHFEDMYACLRSYQKGLEILKYIAQSYGISEKEFPQLLKSFEEMTQRLIQNSSTKENFQSWVSDMEEKIKGIEASKTTREKGSNFIFSSSNRPTVVNSEADNSLYTVPSKLDP